MLTWIKEHATPHVPDASLPRSQPSGHTAVACLLGLLLGVTATALGVLVSWWLVLPYLLIMVWLLLPAGQVAAWTRALATPQNGASVAAAPREPVAAPAPAEPAPSWDVSPPTAAVATETVVAKPRRRRASRRSRVPVEVAEPVAATWVQVGPGRFVRVEVSEPPASESSETSEAVASEPVSSPEGLSNESPAPDETSPEMVTDAIADLDSEPAGPDAEEAAPAEIFHDVEESFDLEEASEGDNDEEPRVW